MAVKKSLAFKRRRKGLTNYKKRLALVKGGMERVIVRRSNRRIIGEVAMYSEHGDMITAYADSNELKGMGWPSHSNRATAYLTGMLLASKALKKSKDSEYVLDIGLSSPVKNSIPFVFAKGCIDRGMKLRSGVEIPDTVYDCSDTAYAASLKKEISKYERQYGAYIKAGKEPDKLNSLFNELRSKLAKE